MTSFVKTIFFLYSVALLCSMAGMELFGWLLAASGLVLGYSRWGGTLLDKPHFLKLPWVAALTLAFISAVGLLKADLPWDTTFHTIMIYRWIGLLVGFFFVIQYARHKQFNLEKGLHVFLILAGIVALYALSQYWHGIDIVRGPDNPVPWAWVDWETGEGRHRSMAFFTLPLTYGYSFGMIFCLGLAYLLLNHSRLHKPLKVLLSLSLLIIGASLITTYTRGVWMGIFPAAFLILFFYKKKFAAIGLTIALVMGGLGLVLSDHLRERVTSFTETDTNRSNLHRIHLWQANWAMFKDHPLLGVGYFQNGGERLRSYYHELGIEDYIISHAHNNYLEYLAGTGILGFIAFMIFISWFIYAAYYLWKALPPDKTFERSLALGALGAQVVLHIGGLTEVNFDDGEVQHLYLIIFASLLVLYRQQTQYNS